MNARGYWILSSILAGASACAHNAQSPPAGMAEAQSSSPGDRCPIAKVGGVGETLGDTNDGVAITFTTFTAGKTEVDRVRRAARDMSSRANAGQDPLRACSCGSGAMSNRASAQNDVWERQMRGSPSMQAESSTAIPAKTTVVDTPNGASIQFHAGDPRDVPALRDDVRGAFYSMKASDCAGR
jgi:hypothetical protein